MSRNPDAVVRVLQAARSIALISHVDPDGDTIGSTLALKLGLEQLGKTAAVFCPSKIPDQLSVLPGASAYRTEAPGEHFDLLMTVDVSSPERTGCCASLFQQADRTAQIDHHGTNPLFMEINDVDGKASASSLLVYEVLSLLGVKLTSEMAMCLYAAIATDTGNFAYDAVNSETFRVMAALMETGFPLPVMNRLLFRTRPAAQVRLLNRALNTLQFHMDGKVTSMVLRQSDFAQTGALPEHSDTIVNYGIDIQGVSASFLLKELPGGRFKASLRAIAPCNVAEVAGKWNGGGHPQAAGCSLEGTEQECRDALTAAVSAAVEAAR